LAKVRIAILSPLAAVIRPILTSSNTRSLDPHESASPKQHLDQFRRFCIARPSSVDLTHYYHLAVWHSGRTLVFDRRTFLSHARPAADGWPLMWVSRPL